jgi:polyisoprenoid-binding protein YceI
MRRTSAFLTLPALLVFLVAGATEVRAAPTTWEIDSTHSSLLFRVKHMNVSHVWGRFDEFSGSFTMDDENLAQAKVQVTVQVASVDTGNAKRDQHLKSPDFFNAAQFPTMTFESKTVARSEGGYDVTGDLTIHGTTKSVTLPMKKVGEASDLEGHRRIGFDGTLTIRRSDFGMSTMIGPLGDEVLLTLAVEAVQK